MVSKLENSALPEDGSAELHFLLASVDRRRILSELQRGEFHVNEMAKKIEMTATETLRQFQRLKEGGLIEKLSDGSYRLTPFGKLVLEEASPIDFISGFKEYFTVHDAFALPRELRTRLADLAGCELVTNNTEALNLVEEMVRNAGKQIDATVTGLEVLMKIAMERVQEGVQERWLLHENYLTRAKTFLRSVKQLPEMRTAPAIKVDLVLTEKMVAVALPLNQGTHADPDFTFFGSDPYSIRWANDLFDEEWSRARVWYP